MFAPRYGTYDHVILEFALGPNFGLGLGQKRHNMRCFWLEEQNVGSTTQYYLESEDADIIISIRIKNNFIQIILYSTSSDNWS